MQDLTVQKIYYCIWFGCNKFSSSLSELCVSAIQSWPMAQTQASTPTSSSLSTEKEYAGVKISLENCLFPQEVFQRTPSQIDGLEREAEDDLRRIGCEFIQIAGIMLKVPQVAMATAQVLFQRFFFAKSFVKHKMEEIAMACIWLASKVEECPRRVRDVINVFHYLRLQRNKLPITPMVLDQDYVTLKNNVIKAERRVLKELGFCVHVKHPHKIIVVYLQVLELERNRELVQTAWNYMNDSLQTTVFVQYSPETIACACIYLAARVLQIPLPSRPSWFYLFNSTEEDLQKICLSLLCVYQTVKTPYEELEKKVDACREAIQQEKLKAKLSQIGEASQSTANSPLSKPTSPAAGSPFKEDKGPSVHRSSTVPTNSDDVSHVTNGNNGKRDGLRRSHDSGLKRSRSRSDSHHHSGKYKGRSSTNSSSSESSPDVRGKKMRHELPKSYSQHNSNRDSEERRRTSRKDRKQRHSKRHRRRDVHRSGGSSRNYRHDGSKKHKRKFTPDTSPKKPSSYVNGDDLSPDSPSSKKRHRHRSHKDSNKKRRSHSPNRINKR